MFCVVINVGLRSGVTHKCAVCGVWVSLIEEQSLQLCMSERTHCLGHTSLSTPSKEGTWGEGEKPDTTNDRESSSLDIRSLCSAL